MKRIGAGAVVIGGAMAVALMGGCQPTVKVEPIEVKPIHVTVDVNIKVDKELDRFFDFEDELAPSGKPQPDTRKPAGGAP
ncbi:MAG: hypothetical protein ACYC26_03690 [Phycisphaerales bacterium]